MENTSNFRPALIQVCFTVDSNRDTVRRQLEQLKTESPKAEFISCFLPRHIVEEKNFDTWICDALDGVLGDKHTYAAKDCKNMEEYNHKLEEIRNHVSSSIDKLYVLNSETAIGVATEIQLFTRNRVILMK